jgi:hypothetical protein
VAGEVVKVLRITSDAGQAKNCGTTVPGVAVFAKVKFKPVLRMKSLLAVSGRGRGSVCDHGMNISSSG